MSSIGPVVSEEKMFENVDGRRTDDGRRSHWYTISSPMSLRLRLANNKESSSNYLFNMVQKILTGHNHILNSINSKLIVLNILYP